MALVVAGAAGVAGVSSGFAPAGDTSTGAVCAGGGGGVVAVGTGGDGAVSDGGVCATASGVSASDSNNASDTRAAGTAEVLTSFMA